MKSRFRPPASLLALRCIPAVCLPSSCPHTTRHVSRKCMLTSQEMNVSPWDKPGNENTGWHSQRPSSELSRSAADLFDPKGHTKVHIAKAVDHREDEKSADLSLFLFRCDVLQPTSPILCPSYTVWQQTHRPPSSTLMLTLASLILTVYMPLRLKCCHYDTSPWQQWLSPGDRLVYD